MQLVLNLSLIERGQPQMVPRSDWIKYDLGPGMRALATKSIIKLTDVGAGVVVTPSHYVGEMRIADVRLEIRPKSPALFEAMQSLAMRTSPKSVIKPEQVTVGGDRQESTAAEFVRLLSNTLMEGIPWIYGNVSHDTSQPRGRLEISKTISRYASRGIHHRAVVRTTSRCQIADFSLVVRAAHGLLSDFEGTTPEHLVRADILIAAIEPIQPVAGVQSAISVAERLLAEEWIAGAQRRLISACLDILRGQSIVASETYSVPGGNAHFYDLERLWELSVLQFIEHCPILADQGEVKDHGLKGAGVRLFRDGGPYIDPDVIVQRENGISAVVDAKYKHYDAGDGPASDLYQIAAYVGVTGAAVGMLIYFSEAGDSVEFIGTTPGGGRVYSASLSPHTILSEREGALTKSIADSPSAKQSLAESLGHVLGN